MTLILVCAVALVGLCVFDLFSRNKKKGRTVKKDAQKTDLSHISLDVTSHDEYDARMKELEASQCCGAHDVCEKEQMIRALRQKIEYFNDEELDAYQGIGEDDYTDDQIEEFREVLYTMHASEIEDWLKSLSLRGVALPILLKDEACQLIASGRSA